METGDMRIILERIDGAVPAGVVFGPGNPNNWSIRDTLGEVAKSRCQGIDAVSATRQAFDIYAALHARFFEDEASLLGGAASSWLRAANWYRGEAKESWEAAQAMASRAWAGVVAQLDAGDGPACKIQWDAHVVACLTESFRKMSWEAFQEERKTRPFSLVHGDAHAHNALWCEKEKRLVLIDFEMIGVGSPAQELGQWTISHMEPELRRAHEKELVAGYHQKLVELLKARDCPAAAEVSFESCWNEYVAGGAGRWAWFVPLFSAMMPSMAQFFQDQLAGFLKDHVKDPGLMPMPRV